MNSSKNDDEIDESQVPFWTSSRLGLAVIGFFGFINVYAQRVNMSVAMVCMVNQTAIKELSMNDNDTRGMSPLTNDTTELQYCDAGGNQTADRIDGEFVWDKSIQGLVLSALFWGYLVTQLPGGWLATKFGGKRVYFWSMVLSTVATILTPIGARTSYILLVILRMIVGFGSGTTFPAMHAMWGHWAPLSERSRLTTFTYAGAQVGNVITFPMAGVLCKYGFDGGWASIFYVIGISSAIWSVAWMLLVTDSPADHKRISSIEKAYILRSLKGSGGEEKSQDRVPWKAILTSMPLYAIIVANFTSDWGAYTLLTGIPSYMSEVLKLDITSNGLYSALPYVIFWAIINVTGWWADYVRARYITTTTTRKIVQSFGMVIPAGLLIGLGYLDCTQTSGALVLLTFSICLTGTQFSGYVINHVDLAPGYAGILFGISNSIAALSGFVAPVLMGYITKDQTREQWQIVFYVTAGIYVFGAVFYVLFASGELQSWAHKKTDYVEQELKPLKGDDIKHVNA